MPITPQQLYTQLTTDYKKFQARDSQQDMIVAIDECFANIDPEEKDGHNICMIEAPTGTGKSLAYILAGVLNAQREGKKFVISTATKTLQGQLYNKDFPQFIQDAKLKLAVVLAKGRSNYLCPYQLETSLMEVGADLLKDQEQTKLLKVSEVFQKGKWDGDLDNAPIAIENKYKPLITSDKYQCLGYQCAYNQKDDSKCPFYRNRESLKNSDVIITNHSLLLADLDSGGGNVLPFKPSDYYLCIDEAHNFTNYAINGFMGQFELKQSIGLLNNLVRLVCNPQNASYIIDDVTLCDESVVRAQELGVSLEKFQQILQLNLNLFNDNILLLNDYLNPVITSDITDVFVEIAFCAGELLADLLKIQDKLKENLKKESNYISEANLQKLNFYFSAVESISCTSDYLINKDNSRFNANARWVERKLTQGIDDFLIIAGVTHVGNLLFNKLWSKVYAACLTSATLAIGESFEYLKFQLGLNGLPNIKTKKLATCFNYSDHSQLVIPQFRFAPEYTMREQFQKELSLYLKQILSYDQAYGTLVLFFNRQQLIETFKQLPVKLQNRILLQTEYSSNQKLISEHQETIDAGQVSIIFGLNSFAEGVDLPAKYCMHVIISKLPFETHKDPQNMVREYWVKAENGNYFMDVSLPETCIKLIQAVGRLIRDERDYGQVTICDNRIALKQYGSIMLKALPEFSRIYNPQFIEQSFSKIEH